MYLLFVTGACRMFTGGEKLGDFLKAASEEKPDSICLGTSLDLTVQVQI